MFMKRLVYLMRHMLLTSILISCASTTPTPSAKMIEPGDKIGNMIVEQGAEPILGPWVWEFCEFWDPGPEPASFTSDCTVPAIPEVAFGFGFYAQEATLSSNWEAMTWEITIDDYQLDLEKFEWVESDFPEMGPNAKKRNWLIKLINSTLGEHSFRYSWTIETPIDFDGHIFQPGTYEHIVNFTVVEQEVYPTLPSTVSSGQHRYSSEKAGLDYLLYVPEDYGKDTQQKWPLILYLHGGDRRNATLALLENDFLPRTLKDQDDFSFIVVSPLGESEEYEFWPENEMVDSVFVLLDEIQAAVSVDSDRIYLTGSSSGGNGTWGIGLQHPEYFAALAPVAGYYGWPFTVPENICDLKNVPVWVFHGEKDYIVPLDAEQKIVEALEDCSGDVQFTIFPGAGHDIDEEVYANPDLYTWFLAHSLE
jgi:hypothetical protein